MCYSVQLQYEGSSTYYQHYTAHYYEAGKRVLVTNIYTHSLADARIQAHMFLKEVIK